MSLADPQDAKSVLRALLRGARGDGDAAELVRAVLALPWPTQAVLAGIWPLPGEPSLVPAWDALHGRGHRIVLPETTPPGTMLVFRLWTPQAVLRPGRFGTLYPDGPVLRPGIVFVPLLAWDRSLSRLGYGGGYYDRTLAALPDAVAVGIGFAAQEVQAVPVGPYDVPLDAMVTEHGLVRAEGQGEGRNFAHLVSGRHRRTQRP